MTLTDVVIYCSADRSFVREYDRLTGASMGSILSASPIESAIDKSTGRYRAEWEKFMAFVINTVWCRLPREEKT